MQTAVVTVLQFDEISSRVCSRFKPRIFAFAAILELPGVMVVTVQQFEIRPIHLQNGSRGMSSGKANSFPCWHLEDGSVVALGNADFGGDSSAVRDQAYPSSKWQQRHEQWQSKLIPLLTFGRWIRRDMGECTLWRWQFSSSRSGLSIFRMAAEAWAVAKQTHSFADIWKMDPTLPWAMQTLVVTVQQFEIRPIHLQNGSRGMSSGKANSFLCWHLEDGSVVTWGNAHYGGDSSAVRDQAYPSSEWQQRHEQWQSKLIPLLTFGRWIRRCLGQCRLWWWQFSSSRSGLSIFRMAAEAWAVAKQTHSFADIWKMDPFWKVSAQCHSVDINSWPKDPTLPTKRNRLRVT